MLFSWMNITDFKSTLVYMAARQRVIDLSLVIDSDCVDLGIVRSQFGVTSWNDDRRPSQYCVGSNDSVDPGVVFDV